ncbi:BamA/TamA family outer membrane protein [Rhizosphaericola mali]|uniref:BamA/TamA family outer membrane protein n=1 Tax=Rhizosphaericola mali TaxID=2545455 RepID=A0A5P2G5N2_9BACT|nr:BamA/TamA family outer membrane protein [Rhizosphaericola mali]QES90845.1 BamA/TamA family outer membrane protein [Rhizosphaericola mali]
MLIIFSKVRAQDSTKHGTLYKMFIASNPVDSVQDLSKIFVVPVFGHTPEGGYEFGGAGFKNFYLSDNKNYRASYITTKLSATTKKAVNFIMYGELWNHQNKDLLTFDIRRQDYPFYYYGIGNNTSVNNKVQLNEKLSHVNVEIAHAIIPHYYVGANILLEEQLFYSRDSSNFSHFHIPTNQHVGRYLSLGVTQTYDNRDNIQYTTKGIYAYVRGSVMPGIRAFKNYFGAQYNVNFKAFLPIHPKLVVGYNFVYNQFTSKNVPFYLLPQLGNDEIMRGYYEGRFRGKQLSAQQLELRYRFIPRIAVTSFASVGETTANIWTRGNLRSSYGGGVRYFFDVKQGSTVRLDYAITQKVNGEKRSTGIYILLGEAF